MIPSGSKAFLELALAEAFSLGSGSVSVREGAFWKARLSQVQVQQDPPSARSAVSESLGRHRRYPTAASPSLWRNRDTELPKLSSKMHVPNAIVQMPVGCQSKESSDTSRAGISPDAPVPS